MDKKKERERETIVALHQREWMLSGGEEEERREEKKKIAVALASITSKRMPCQVIRTQHTRQSSRVDGVKKTSDSSKASKPISIRSELGKTLTLCE